MWSSQDTVCMEGRERAGRRCQETGNCVSLRRADVFPAGRSDVYVRPFQVPETELAVGYRRGHLLPALRKTGQAQRHPRELHSHLPLNCLGQSTYKGSEQCTQTQEKGHFPTYKNKIY